MIIIVMIIVITIFLVKAIEVLLFLFCSIIIIINIISPLNLNTFVYSVHKPHCNHDRMLFPSSENKLQRHLFLLKFLKDIDVIIIIIKNYVSLTIFFFFDNKK